MRIALFADIHANLEALEAVLADSNSMSCDEYICLGDIVGYNADPVACLEKIQAMGCPVVKGNHDEEASSDLGLDTMNPVAAQALQWTRDQLSEDQKNWLRNLRMVRQVHDFTVVHSTLDQPDAWHYVTNKFDAMSNFSFQYTQVCFHGHTHVPKFYVKAQRVSEVPGDSIKVEEGSKYFINTGSVGQPRDGEWKACYTIYDTETQEITFRRVEYDIQATQQKIIDAGLPPVLASRLNDGR